MSRSSIVDYEAAPADALAKWQAQRYAARADYVNILNERENQILGLSEKSGPKSDRYTNARRDLDEAQREFERIHSVVRRPLHKWHLPHWTLIAIGLALAIFEAPVNKFLFDVALQSSNLWSYTISFGFAAALLVLAHVAGFSLRQFWSEQRKRPVWSSLVILLLTCLVLFALVSILTIARASFSSESATIRDLLSDVTATITQVGLWSALAGAFTDMHALVLATVNIGGIFVTMMLSFFTHDPDKDFDVAARAVERHRKTMAKIVKDFLQRKDKFVKDMAPHLTGHSANYKTANMNVIELKKRLGQALDEEDRVVIDELDTMAEDSIHWSDIEREMAEVVAVRRKGPIASVPTSGRRDPAAMGQRSEAG